MIEKKDFKKINDYLWEIPKSFRPDMRVPARIYVSEKMLGQLERGAIEQIINVTAFPGIVKYSLAMPDAHTGYGMVIGGVAATKYPSGIISPGGIGFDENCLSGNTKVLCSLGYYLSVSEFKKSDLGKIKCVNFNENKIEEASIFNFFKRKTSHIYKVITKSGQKIKATEDHPIQTKQGMKKIKDLQGNESVLVYPFKGVKYKKPSSETILDEKRFRKILVKLGKNNQQGHAISQILNQLKSRDLLPLRYNSPYLPQILKLIGFIFGDGVISFEKNPQLGFYGKPEDLLEIQKDIKKLGFSPPQIYNRKRNHSITTFYGNCKFSTTEHSIKIGSGSLASLFIALGTPFGLKTHQSYRIPKWIFKCPLWEKRLFLASFFGAELSSPSTLNKYNFYAPQLNVQKVKGLEGSAKLFLKDIVRLLQEFGVQTDRVVEVPGYQYKGKQGETSGFRLHINGEAENLIKFFEIVNYEYNQEKHKKACLAASYLKRKLRIVRLRTEAREKIKSLYQKRGDFKKLAEKYASEYAPVQFLYHSLFEEDSWGVRKKRGNPRIAFNFPSFKDYVKKNSYGNRGLFWDEIEKIEKFSYHNFVYDFTVNHPDHNFIANNFVVSNCGVRLLKSEYTEQEISPYLEKLISEMQREIPSGLGRGRKIKFTVKEINEILEGGIPYLVKRGYGTEEDVANCEEQGKMPEADASCVSERAKQRGRDQVGTLGSGNHFCEIQKVIEIFDEKVAKVFGLFKNQIVVMIHTGSRGLGHQNCTDYLRLVIPAYSRYGIKLPDKELACVPFNTPLGQRFFKAMSAACNYAWANRHMIAFYIKKVWKKVLGEKANLSLLYDVAHNIAKIEEHEVDPSPLAKGDRVDGQKMKLIVHRKGATRAFPPEHPEIPTKYRKTGQPVLIPGSMGTASYILSGTQKAKESFFSVCHGAGRMMSRHEALRRVSGPELKTKLEKRGIIIKAGSLRGLAEEAPSAYKDVDQVIEVVSRAGLANKVACLVPLAVIKG